MIDIRYTLWIFQNDQSNITINGNNYDFNITGCTAQINYSTLNDKCLVALLYTQVIYFNIAYFVTKRLLLQQSQVKNSIMQPYLYLVSCTPQCIHTEQTTKAKCASTYLQLHHMFRQCLRNGGMVLGANRNNWQNIEAIPYPVPRIRKLAKG